MPAVSPKLDLLESLKSEIGIADEAVNHVIELTPYLALAVALLYMMASDGEIEDQESSQLQSVLGGDKEVLRYGLSYVQSVSIDQFLVDATENLSDKDRLCILTNVCDSLLSDGHADDEELALFYRMVTAFGLTKKSFEPYFKTIALKNDKTVLGLFEGASDEVLKISPHHALAISLLYMMTADGAIGEEEIGQLEAVIGEFDGLQKVALKYVRQTKIKQFLDSATGVLTTEQKLYILTNVCDSMLSDGDVARLENKLFQTILTAFGYDDVSFESYYQTIEIKNVKPFDTSDFKPKITHRRLKSSGKDADGVAFDNKLSTPELSYQNGAGDFAPAANQKVWNDGVSAVSLGTLIQRTMNDNIDQVAHDFENNANLVKVGHNATDDLNLQKLGQDQDPENRQQVAGANALANHRQSIDATADAPNTQVLALTAVAQNLQAIDQDHMKNHREVVPVEARMQTLYEGIDHLNQRLNQFEKENKDFLDAIRAEMLIDVAGVVVKVSSEEQELLDMVADMLRIENVQDIAQAGVDLNLQQVPSAESQSNLQQVPFTQTQDNFQPAPTAEVPDNIQEIALKGEVENIQKLGLANTQDNRQTIGVNATAPNDQLIRQEKTLDLSAMSTQTLAVTNGVDSSANSAHEAAAHNDEGTHSHISWANADGTPTDSAVAEVVISRPHPRHHVWMGRGSPMDLNWWYARTKAAVVFSLFVFAMPINSKVPVSRMAAGFLISADASSERLGDLPAEKFNLVKLDRD
jgi:uncharacterized tellurite resistance protein B-like protein